MKTGMLLTPIDRQGRSSGEMYQLIGDTIVELDTLGYDEVYLGEHDAADAAMFDHMSGGRFVLGVGRRLTELPDRTARPEQGSHDHDEDRDMATPQHFSGCLSCGDELAYLERAEPMVCAGCGRTHESNARCVNGHFFCDVCHSGETVEVIERLCLDSTQTDPVALSRTVMRHPKVKMHGSEHHYLTPAALLSAYCNVRGEPAERKASLLAEAKKRAVQVPGGTCGYWGACGAGIGAGIFVSLVTGATPRSKEPWALAQAMTSEVLGLYAKLGGPRCCKRNTWVATLAAAKLARQHFDTPMTARGARCELSPLNPDCHKQECPFHPRTGPDAAT